MSLRHQLSENPLVDLGLWLDHASKLGLPEPNAMTLATTDSQGKPSARIVLCKAIVPGGIHFFTNYESRKSQNLLSNPHASVVFFWPTLARQVRVEGTVSKVPREVSEEYFRSRPRGSQIGAWVSKQSSPIPDFETLEKLYQVKEKEFEGKDIACPPHWGGFLLSPTLVEFWIGLPSRLHDRVVVTKKEKDSDYVWVKTQLAP